MLPLMDPAPMTHPVVLSDVLVTPGKALLPGEKLAGTVHDHAPEMVRGPSAVTRVLPCRSAGEFRTFVGAWAYATTANNPATKHPARKRRCFICPALARLAAAAGAACAVLPQYSAAPSARNAGHSPATGVPRETPPRAR